jgi:hypothetical protein
LGLVLIDRDRARAAAIETEERRRGVRIWFHPRDVKGAARGEAIQRCVP